jgi:hypothetical protein
MDGLTTIDKLLLLNTALANVLGDADGGHICYAPRWADTNFAMARAL